MRTCVAVWAATAAAAHAGPVAVPGSDVRFPDRVAVTTAGGKAADLALTGAGLRTKFYFSVYVVASYVDAKANPRTAADVVAADAVKMLHLVMERDVSGADVTGAIRAAVSKAHPGGRFAAEFAALSAALGDRRIARGQHLRLVSSPAGGLTLRVGNGPEVAAGGPEFAKAVWAVYLGPAPVDDRLKAALAGRLGR